MANTITVANGYTLYTSGGVEYLSSGGSVTSYTPTDADIITVQNGGTAIDVGIGAGGKITVAAGGVTSNATIGSGGVEVVSSGGTASGTVVANGGTLSAAVNAMTTGVSVASGGTLFLPTQNEVLQGAITVTSGAMIVFNGQGPGSGVSITEDATGLITVSGNKGVEKVQLTGSATFTSAATSTNKVEVLITCYASGTEILTESGPKPVEAVMPSDKVVVRREGHDVLEPVIWVGSSHIDLTHHARPELAAPIRIKAGALGENIPTRDLVLSPEHCLILDGRAVPVKLLVNGGSIAREFPAEPFTYYHIELDRHGILLAEGTESESYLDTGNRASFDNAGTPRLLHPTFEVNPTAERWNTDACAPLAQVPGEVAPIWQSLAERSDAMGLKIPTPATVASPDVHLTVDGKRIQPTSDRNGRYVFMVPAGATAVSLDSRFCIPADKMIPGMRDTRRLGLSVDWMAIRTATAETILAADHPSLTAGWHDIERDNGTMWRWTDGAATIPWSNIQGSAVLTIKCKPVAQYPIYDEKLRLVA